MKKVSTRKSKIAGRGVFADEDIKKGEYIMPLKGKLIHKKYQKARDYHHSSEQSWVPVTFDWWINPSFPIKFLNHSCNPNAGFKTPRRLYAMKQIQKGEEITVDYSTIEYTPFWQIKCNCGSVHCRKIIKSIDTLPLRRFNAYLPYIPKFLQGFYRRCLNTVS